MITATGTKSTISSSTRSRKNTISKQLSFLTSIFLVTYPGTTGFQYVFVVTSLRYVSESCSFLKIHQRKLLNAIGVGNEGFDDFLCLPFQCAHAKPVTPFFETIAMRLYSSRNCGTSTVLVVTDNRC